MAHTTLALSIGLVHWVISQEDWRGCQLGFPTTWSYYTGNSYDSKESAEHLRAEQEKGINILYIIRQGYWLDAPAIAVS